MSVVPEELLHRVRAGMRGLQPPGHYDKVYKDECMYSFDTPESPGGLFVNLRSYQVSCFTALLLHLHAVNAFPMPRLLLQAICHRMRHMLRRQQHGGLVAVGCCVQLWYLCIQRNTVVTSYSSLHCTFRLPVADIVHTTLQKRMSAFAL